MSLSLGTNGSFPMLTVDNWPVLGYLEMSYSHFTGPLFVTNMAKLQLLNANGNMFTGSVPGAVASTIESLSLANNFLSGPMPTVLGSLSVLNQLSLADNAGVGT